MKSFIALLFSLLFIVTAAGQANQQERPQQNQQENPANAPRQRRPPPPPDLSAKMLFNGKDLSGWHIDVPAMDEDPSLTSPFIVRNGMLVSLGTPQGHIITDAAYQNYSLTVEYRWVGKPGNSGVIVNASLPRVYSRMFPQSIEVQMMAGNAGDFYCIHEDIAAPNMVERRGPPEKWGTTQGTSRRIANLTDDSENPPGEWNQFIIECIGDQIKVWLNGDLVNYGYNCTADKGQIALQAEGAEVEFRKVELTPFVPLNE
jgi:hypothetical protein